MSAHALRKPSIIGSRETVTYQGVVYPLPSAEDYRSEKAITAQQETLFGMFCRCPATEEGQGRALSLQRRVAKLELRKHPLLRTWNKHLLG